MALPVFHSNFQLRHCLGLLLSINRRVRSLQNRLSRFLALQQISLSIFIQVALLVKIREQQGVLGEALEGLHEERREGGRGLDDLNHFAITAGGSELRVFLRHSALASPLVRDVGFVDAERIAVENEKTTPILFVFGEGISLFDADEEAALEIEEGVEVEEDRVYRVAWDDAARFDQRFEAL
ncbi:hypothetical protein KC361_g249 [Hortaea werneckii]|nr:hypothetical protein KC361_g249 [Hortaea werneckii]